MFYPFTIEASTINQLKCETGAYYSADEDPDKYTREAQLRQYLASTNGLIDGKALKEVLFPKGKYHVFLSHSHGDLQIAHYLCLFTAIVMELWKSNKRNQHYGVKLVDYVDL